MDQASAALVEQSLLQVAQNVEEQLDAQIHQLENLGEDDLERIRRKRVDEYRRYAGCPTDGLVSIAYLRSYTLDD